MMSTTLKGLRPGFHTITPYLIVDGAADFIQFLKDAFSAEESGRFMRPEGEKIMHAEMTVGNSRLELADATEQIKPRPGALHLYLDDIDAVYQRAVRAGATSLMGPTDQFYGDREAALRDRRGNSWYVATHLADPSTTPIRKGFRPPTPSLHAQGAARLMGFIKEAFGARAVEEPTMSPQGTIAHATLRLGDWVIRTFLFDHFISEAIAGGADTIINLAAGLDARPYRMNLPPALKWVEVDLPPLLSYKEEILRADKPNCRLERIPADLGDRAARQELFEHLDASAKNALVITEGLLIYLTPEDARAFADDLAERRSFHRWVLDVVSPGLLRM